MLAEFNSLIVSVSVCVCVCRAVFLARLACDWLMGCHVTWGKRKCVIQVEFCVLLHTTVHTKLLLASRGQPDLVAKRQRMTGRQKGEEPNLVTMFLLV